MRKSGWCNTVGRGGDWGKLEKAHLSYKGGNFSGKAHGCCLWLDLVFHENVALYSYR